MYRLNWGICNVGTQVSIMPKLMGPDVMEDEFPPQWEFDLLEQQGDVRFVLWRQALSRRAEDRHITRLRPSVSQRCGSRGSRDCH